MRNLFLILAFASSAIAAKAQTFSYYVIPAQQGYSYNVTCNVNAVSDKKYMISIVFSPDRTKGFLFKNQYFTTSEMGSTCPPNGESTVSLELEYSYTNSKGAQGTRSISLPKTSLEFSQEFTPFSDEKITFTRIKKASAGLDDPSNACSVRALELYQQKYQKSSTTAAANTNQNTNSNQPTTQNAAETTTSSRPNYQAQWNNQVAQDKQNMNQSIDNLSNTVSQWAQNKREERLAEQEQKEQREREAYNRRVELLNKVNRRKAIVADFPAKDIPLGSQEKAERIYYFVYAYENLENEYTAVFVSNVFEIGKYADGTRAYTATVKKDIEKLTPYAEVLYGYYTSQEECEEALAYFIDALKNNDVLVNYLTYKGKPGATNTANNTTENNNSKYEKVIGAPAKIDTRSNNGVAPNKAVDKANNKDEKIIN